MPRQPVDVAKIANKLGISTTTVSYILRGKHEQVKIAPRTAQRVLEAARELGYRSNFWARALARKQSRLIGVMFPDISGSSAQQVSEGIEEALGEDSYQTVLAVSFWKKEKERREVELMLEKRVEGIIALPQAGSQEVFQVAIDAGCPVIFICDWLPGLAASSVTLDAEDAINKLLDHLYEMGRRKIHFLSVKYPSKTLQEREQAFIAGMARLGMSLSSSDITYTELSDPASIYSKTRQIVQSQNRLDALLCISDAVAFLAMSEMRRLRVQPPEPFAVAGIGNSSLWDCPLFDLTTVDECRREIGRQAVNLLMKQLGTDSRPLEHSRIKGPLIIRSSTTGGTQ